ncbi:tetratricopeptide repeat protein [Litorilituus lipolyticus]|uniref:Tetratricopeptide repeat protein n=1 Tax=Litorilituus lipolyticus TaxID=2491017 RepID=A0A502L801_9GAMM|nr:tetratricopeptide repeat protein [Litorilituus lipolyticus]TPH18605.1 tetratricopeptide repeat protein [Litorilituus lipolyticus]
MMTSFKKLLFPIHCLVCLTLASQGIAKANNHDFTIKVAKPTFVLPSFAGPYQEREATIAPEEYETAERLRGLLDSGQKAQVLTELESYFDLELSPAMLSLKAQIYFSLEQFDKAEQTFLNVLSRKPQLVRVHRDLGQLYLIQEKYKLARHHFSEAISLGSNEAMIHGQLGYLNLTLHGPFSAIAAYQKAMTLQPEEVQWQQGLLAALTQAKMYESAQALISELLVKDPNNKDLWLNQAVLAINSDKTNLALVSLEMAIMLGDEDDLNLKTATQLHLQMHSYDRAIALINEHLSQSALDMQLLNEYLTWLEQVDMWQQADTLLSGVESKVKALPKAKQSIFYRHKATIAVKKKDIKAAQGYFRLALEQNANNGDALLSFAQLSMAEKDYINAEIYYTRASVLPEFAKQALLGKAQMYIDMLDYKSAISELQKAYGRYPELHYLPEQMEILKNILRTKQKTNV